MIERNVSSIPCLQRELEAPECRAVWTVPSQNNDDFTVTKINIRVDMRKIRQQWSPEDHLEPSVVSF